MKKATSQKKLYIKAESFKLRPSTSEKKNDLLILKLFLIYLVNLKWMGRGFVPRSCLAVLLLVGGRFLGRNSLYRRHAEIIGRLRTPNAASRPFARFWAHAYFPGCATIVVANVWYTSESEGILWNAWMLGWVFFKWIQNDQKAPYKFGFEAFVFKWIPKILKICTS